MEIDDMFEDDDYHNLATRLTCLNEYITEQEAGKAMGIYQQVYSIELINADGDKTIARNLANTALKHYIDSLEVKYFGGN